MWIIYGNGNIDSAYGYHMGPMWESLIPTGMTSVWMPISRNFWNVFFVEKLQPYPEPQALYQTVYRLIHTINQKCIHSSITTTVDIQLRKYSIWISPDQLPVAA